MFAKAFPFLCMFLVGALSSSVTVPFLGYYIVEGLGHEPWRITVYSASVALLTITLNRLFASKLDAGHRFRPFLFGAAAGFLVACSAMLALPSYVTLLGVGVLGFALASTSMASMFTYGRHYAEAHGLPPERFNAYVRATSSTAWMIGPALAFSIVYRVDPVTVFGVGMALALVWIALVLWLVPATAAARPSPSDGTKGSSSAANTKALWQASAVCFFFATAHLLCSAALPLFYIQEAGLPEFAPGISFPVKTAVEIAAILSTPFLMQRFGARPVLMINAILAVVAFLVLAQVSNLPIMVLGAALEGLYYGIFAGISVTFVQSFAAGRMAHATSMYVNALFLGGLVATPAVGLIAQFFSFRTSILLACIGALLAFAVLATMRPASRKRPSAAR